MGTDYELIALIVVCVGGVLLVLWLQTRPR